MHMVGETVTPYFSSDGCNTIILQVMPKIINDLVISTDNYWQGRQALVFAHAHIQWTQLNLVLCTCAYYTMVPLEVVAFYLVSNKQTGIKQRYDVATHRQNGRLNLLSFSQLKSLGNDVHSNETCPL